MTNNPIKMYFVNNEHLDGLNVTVRLGDKWAVRVSEGEQIELVDIQEDEGQYAVVTDIRVCNLEDCDTEWLAYEHSPRCRTLDGLHQALMEIYGEHIEMDPQKLWKQPVTMVAYEV